MQRNRKYSILLLGILLLGVCTVYANEHKTSKGLTFFYKLGYNIDRILTQHVDTNYIALPEHSWHVSLNAGEYGVHSTYTAKNVYLLDTISLGDVSVISKTVPGFDLGFQVGYRSFGIGYSWDLLNTYAQKLNFTLGGQAWGLEFLHQRSQRMRESIRVANFNDQYYPMQEGDIWVTNTNLSAWFAFNSSHYSHNAAIKQAYIQRRSAGSLLLHASYMASDIQFKDTLNVLSIIFLQNVTRLQTHQAAVGIGYGINYTPNKGKVLLHASATAKLVFYSLNQMTFYVPDSLIKYDIPSYAIRPAKPVHFSFTARAAVSWEINRWVHLSAWAQVYDMRFSTSLENLESTMLNWNWQAHLTLGVRLGAGYKRTRPALEDAGVLPREIDCQPSKRPSKLPRWITDFFFSSRL